jgi:hypothetical protein
MCTAYVEDITIARRRISRKTALFEEVAARGWLSVFDDTEEVAF